jgi:hypothetical protein
VVEAANDEIQVELVADCCPAAERNHCEGNINATEHWVGPESICKELIGLDNLGALNLTLEFCFRPKTILNALDRLYRMAH